MALSTNRHLQTPVRPSRPLSATARAPPTLLHLAVGFLPQNGKMNLNPATTPNTADGTSSLLPAKKPKARQTEFADAHRACRTITEREQLALVLKARWAPAELSEYARLFHFRNGKDNPTATSYRCAIADLAVHYRGLGYPDAKPSDYPHEWLRQFRKGGSKPLPPRREGLLQRGRGLSRRISGEEYSWPGHTEEFRSMIEQRTRDYLGIAPEQPVHVNAWAASKRAYDREQQAVALASRRETEAITLSMSPKSRKKSPKAPRRKVVSSFDYSFWGHDGKLKGPLKPHFNHNFEGHTAAFRQEVAALARKDNGLRPNAYISPRRWKVACHKHYVLTQSN